MDQSPKTKDEPVSLYVYDICNQDRAPHAQGRQKYGPNKHTPKWNDEDDFVKSSGTRGQSQKECCGGSIIIKLTGKRIVPEGELPNYPESKEIPPIAQRKENIKSSKSYSKEQQFFKKDSNKVRPEHTRNTFNYQSIDSPSSKPLVPVPTTTNPPLLPPTAHHIGTPELMAAAALSGSVQTGNGAPTNTGNAVVRGSVSYFNPNVQAPNMM
ncbi:unnamed protein product [Lepeophtheirus salmonis]|uniref:(salmon louse) hypothetical protein n=1 Tax=Lepeophtheirus salmonis TaxID=72036 RepID=A0A7R8CN08_LEPSM|nr:unnamed protein product [Lepeophtheirus salmonis]CAF2837974.1 unnamed protein product [Lepeophtheirus salmonis]